MIKKLLKRKRCFFCKKKFLRKSYSEKNNTCKKCYNIIIQKRFLNDI